MRLPSRMKASGRFELVLGGRKTKQDGISCPMVIDVDQFPNTGQATPPPLKKGLTFFSRRRACVAWLAGEQNDAHPRTNIAKFRPYADGSLLRLENLLEDLRAHHARLHMLSNTSHVDLHSLNDNQRTACLNPQHSTHTHPTQQIRFLVTSTNSCSAGSHAARVFRRGRSSNEVVSTRKLRVLQISTSVILCRTRYHTVPGIQRPEYLLG